MPPPCMLTFDLLTLKVVSESRVTWARLFANFSLPSSLCSRLRPNVRDRQTDVRRASSLNAPYPRGWSITTCQKFTEVYLRVKAYICVSSYTML